VSLGLWQDRPAAEVVRTAQAADALGYGEIWIGEMATFDAFALGAVVAERTSRASLTIGPLAVAVRDPVMIAMGAGSLAELTGRTVNVALGSSSPVVVELRIKGPGVFPGYLPASGVPDPFDEDGYLRTGDILEIAGDERQYLRYVDRSKDMVVRGGMKISAAELEGFIAGHPKVADVAVVAYPDEVLGERACAVVVPRPEATVTLEEIVAYLREEGIATFKLPERLEIRDELPRNPLGKILKRELRDELRQ
jgi:acyl-CoA synthetase (AMP-forming)/AMP-acid ligase II